MDSRELPAESRPRTQQKWIEEERRQTKLPTSARDKECAPTYSATEPTDGAVGKKKQKRMKVVLKKEAQKAQKKVKVQAQEVAEAAQSLKGKAGAKELAPAAREVLKRGRKGPESEQQVLATTAERITANPEKDIELFDVFFELHLAGSDARTRQLALLSAVVVFKDLVPGYRIREPTEQEKAVARSKGVLAVEKLELSLLQVYKRLLPALEAGMKANPVAMAPALAALVSTASEFNYRQRLLNTAVKYCNSTASEVRGPVVEALGEMVGADQRLEASREIVLAVGRYAQQLAASCRAGDGGGASGNGAGRLALRHELFDVLLRLPIGRAEDAKINEDAVENADDEVARGIAEASINQRSDVLQKAETELLYEVFVVYLRILRQRQVHARELLTAVLTGLARWGHQVNIELLLEIIGELHFTVQDAIGRSDGLVAIQALNCALKLLGGPSKALIVDVTWLANAMISGLTLILPALFCAFSESPVWPPSKCFSVEGQRLCASAAGLSAAVEAGSAPALVLRCLEAALDCPTCYGRASDAALATLVETLFNLTVTSDAHVALGLLREASLLLRKHYRLYTMLDSEGGLFGLGGLMDHAATVFWHFHPLSFSIVPELAKVGSTLRSAISQRRTLITDMFPARSTQTWFNSEFVKHIGALGDAPVPRARQGDKASSKSRSSASFTTEPELRAALSC